MNLKMLHVRDENIRLYCVHSDRYCVGDTLAPPLPVAIEFVMAI